MDSVQKITMFGCDLQSATAQFGLNQNPTVVTVSVVKEDGQTFSLQNASNHGVRQSQRITIGSLDMRGLIQSWDEQKVSTAGTGVYSVRLTDFRSAMECVQIVLQAPAGQTFGQNIVAVVPDTVEDLTSGVEYDTIRAAIHAQRFVYGGITFSVNLSNLTPTPRSIDGEDISYRLRSSVMSLIEVINQVADDHGWEWFVETSDNHVVTVKTLSRSRHDLDLQKLAEKHPGEIIRLVEGHENRDEETRTVLIGAQKQELVEVPPSRFVPFWGITPEGAVHGGPSFTMVSRDKNSYDINRSVSDCYAVLNGDKIQGLSDTEYAAFKSYADDFWGRKFYCNVSDSNIDINGDCWVDVAAAGWWGGTSTNPADLPVAGEEKFGTEDGRWVSFVKLVPTTTGTWVDGLVMNDAAYVNDDGEVFLKASLERIDLNRAEGLSTLASKRKSIWVMTLPAAMEATIPVVASGTTRTTRATTFGAMYLALTDRRYGYGPWNSETIIPAQKRMPGKTRVYTDTSLSPWNFSFRGTDPSDGIKKMNRVAMARLRTYTHELSELDTGELEVAGLPAVNLGTEIGLGTNVTSITIYYDTRGIRTTYKCNLYTNELGRHQRYYQELVDKLAREARRRQHVLYPQQDFQNLKKTITTGKGTAGANGEQSFVARIDSRGSITEEPNKPIYMCTIMKQVTVNGFVTYTPASIGGSMVTNLSEHPQAPARLPVGTYVRIRPATTIRTTNRSGELTDAILNWVMEETPPTPGTMQCRVLQTLNPPGTSGPPLYRVEVVTGDTSSLTQYELPLFNEVLNVGEPYGSAGYIPLGTTVEVTWTLLADHSYKPTINHALNIFVAPTAP